MKKELIGAARRRLALTGRRTRGVDIRRAISDAYYALFHALAQACADELIGANKRSTDAWARVYRALDHKAAKDRLKKSASAGGADAELIAFATAFASLQELRHEADYSPRAPGHNRQSTLALIDEAEQAIEEFDSLNLFKKRSLAVEILFKDRN